MEELQTDKPSDYGKSQELESGKNNDDTCAALLNGDIDDSLDLMDNCDNVSCATGSNSDVWNGSDSEDDTFEGKENSSPKQVDTNKETLEKTDNPVTGKESKDKTDITENKEANSSDVDTKQNVVENEDTEAKDPDPSIVDKTNEVTKSDENTQPKEEGKGDNTAEKVPVQTDSEKVPEETKEAEKEQPPPENTELKGSESTKEVDKQTDEKSEEEKQSLKITDAATGDKELETPMEAGEKDPTTEDKDPLADTNNEFGEPPPNKCNEGPDDESQMDYDAADDDDFDPSLLCPEVSMAVDDNPVVTTNGGMPNDGCNSPLPYEPVFSTFVDEVTGAEISFNLTSEEQELRKRLYGPTNPVQITRIHCTACNVHLGSALEGQNNRFVHPLLKALICKECYHFYTSGEFEKDEDGSELYCRWCGQGGQVLCCSKCEYVFCKRCIRTNFGRKKMFEIRDSDSWDCFRCNQQQIVTQRVACYEFFEYVRREMQRAATLNSPEIWSKDHTRCCSSKKRGLEAGEEGAPAKRPRKRKSETDPDYNPLLDKPIDIPPLSTAAMPSTSNMQQFGQPRKMMMLNKPGVQIVPRFNKPKDNDIEFVRQIPAPHVTIGTTPRPTYRTILPSSVRPAIHPTLLRISSQPVPPLVPTSNRLLSSALHGRNMNSSNMMKHEWFEKTVRAAARVNSHLSYTLTQLNKAQSQAASVEELAVVHNKLQEILSSSINSLIQIRKNLRTEFIAGIKTVRLPSKKMESSFSNDDDVIFVSAPTTMPVPSTSTVSTAAKDPLSIAAKDPLSTAAKDPLIIIDHSSPGKIQASLLKPMSNAERPKGGYLKVKSVLELQNVTAECITIPDDGPTPPQTKNTGKKSFIQITCNGATETIPSKDVDPLADTPGTGNASSDTATVNLNEVPNETETKTENRDAKRQSDEKSTNEGEIQQNQIETLVYNTKGEPSIDIKRMMTVKVNLQRDNLQELQEKLAGKTE